MARLWIFSDLHVEMGDGPPLVAPRGVDVAVVAGDVAASPMRAVEWLDERMPAGLPVIYVPGNHEFWDCGSMEGAALAGLLASRRAGRVHMLDDDLRVVAGVRFVGATLWTDYALYAVPHEGKLRDEAVAWTMRWADGTSPDSAHGLEATRLRTLHASSRRLIEAALAVDHDGSTVVVTHHAPHPESIPERFRYVSSSNCYASDLEAMIEAGRPDLWIHGHTHDGCDYVVGDTRVVCNPRGFSEENPDFDPGLVVEVG